jgi:hypothetical protein
MRLVISPCLQDISSQRKYNIKLLVAFVSAIISAGVGSHRKRELRVAQLVRFLVVGPAHQGSSPWYSTLVLAFSCTYFRISSISMICWHNSKVLVCVCVSVLCDSQKITELLDVRRWVHISQYLKTTYARWKINFCNIINQSLQHQYMLKVYS